MIANLMRELKLPLKNESIVCLGSMLHSVPCETQYAFRKHFVIGRMLPGTPNGCSCVMMETP